MTKKLLITTFVLSFLFVPLGALAHGGTTDVSETQTGPQMMRYIEDQALGNEELHEEMEQLMTRMMSGELTQPQVERMAELMESYPGVHGMMMNRIGSSDDFMGMHTSNTPSIFSILLVISAGIWIIVGIMFAAYLGRKLSW